VLSFVNGEQVPAIGESGEIGQRAANRNFVDDLTRLDIDYGHGTAAPVGHGRGPTVGEQNSGYGAAQANPRRRWPALPL
jgi:hypothetical protein